MGSEIIRSDPGEPPYREFEKLYKSIKYRIESDAVLSAASLIVYTAYIVALYLEYGTRNMEPRPFWEDSRKEIGDISKLLAALVAERLRRRAVDIGEDFFP